MGYKLKEVIKEQFSCSVRKIGIENGGSEKYYYYFKLCVLSLFMGYHFLNLEIISGITRILSSRGGRLFCSCIPQRCWSLEELLLLIRNEFFLRYF